MMKPGNRSFSELFFEYGLIFCCFHPRFSTLTDLRDTLHPRGYFLDFPTHEVNPAFHIAGRSNEIVLQGHLLQSSIPGSTHSMGSDQLAVGAFDAVASLHPLPKGFGLHLLSSGLEHSVVFTDD